jgi:hypothetical protein
VLGLKPSRFGKTTRSYRLNPAALTPAALGFDDKEALPKAKPVYLALEVLPAEARHSQNDPLLGKQMPSQLLVVQQPCVSVLHPSIPHPSLCVFSLLQAG